MTGSLHSRTAAEPLGSYAHARRAGNLLFLAGMGPRRRGSREIPGVRLDDAGRVVGYDLEAQMRSCFDNIRVILEESGSKWENIIDATVYLTDLEADWAVYNRVWAEFFPPAGASAGAGGGRGAGVGGNPPARTTVEVSALPRGGDAPINVEIKIIATV